MDEMSVEKWWNEIGGRGKREKLREKPTQTPFRPPRNLHGGTNLINILHLSIFMVKKNHKIVTINKLRKFQNSTKLSNGIPS